MFLLISATGGTGPVAGTKHNKARDKVCSNSEEGDECADAVQFCLDCCEQYCKQCSKVHRKTTATSKHTQVALDELSDDMLSEAMSKLETPTCPKHKGETFKLYCSTCQCAVCSICCHIDHQSHTFKEMKDVDDRLKAELDPLVTIVEVLNESVKCQIREVDKTTEVYKENASKARESVKGLFQQMQQMLSQKAAKIDKEICRKYDEAEALANSRSKNLVLNGQLLESLSSFAQNQRKGSVFNRLASLPEVRLQVEKLKQSLDEMLSAPFVPEVPSHTDLFTESVDNLTIETDIPLDPHNPVEKRQLKILQTCNIPKKKKTPRDNGRDRISAHARTPAGANRPEGSLGRPMLDDFSLLTQEDAPKRDRNQSKGTRKSDDGGTGTIMLEEPAVAERVPCRPPEVKESPLFVKRPPRSQLEVPDHTEVSSSVKVYGLKTHIKQKPLELFFKNKEKSGGGPIASIDVDEKEKTAIVTFQSAEVAERVPCRPPEVKESPLFVKRPPRSQLEVPDHTEVSSSVKVYGLKTHIKQKPLELFFKNKEKSGGGPIASIDVDEKEKTAIVTFQSAEDAHRVAEKGLHWIGGCELVVEMTSSASFLKL